MQNDARRQYLENQLRSTGPGKLRLMLIEGGIRMATQAIDFWRKNDIFQAGERASRCRKIVTELFGAISPSQSELARKTADIYAFLLRTVTEASLARSPDKMQQVIDVLEEERQTWALLAARGRSSSDRESIALSNRTDQVDTFRSSPNLPRGDVSWEA